MDIFLELNGLRFALGEELRWHIAGPVPPAEAEWARSTLHLLNVIATPASARLEGYLPDPDLMCAVLAQRTLGGTVVDARASKPGADPEEVQ